MRPREINGRSGLLPDVVNKLWAVQIFLFNHQDHTGCCGTFAREGP